MEIARTHLRQRSGIEISEAIDATPEEFRTHEEFLTAKLLFNEAVDRGPSSIIQNEEAARMLRVRHAEMLLCEDPTFEAGLGQLNAIIQDGAAGGPSKALSRARHIVEALNEIHSQEAYDWGIQQMIMAWEYNVRGVESLAVRLAPTLLKGYDAGMAPSEPPANYIHALQVARALYHWENYADSVRIFEEVMSNTTLSTSSEPYWIAESWRLLALERLAMRQGADHTEAGRKILGEIADYAEFRGPQITDLENQAWLYHHGLWAAEKLGDTLAIRRLRTLEDP